MSMIINFLFFSVVTCPNLVIDYSDSSGLPGTYGDVRTVKCNDGYETLTGLKSFDVTCHIPNTVVNNDGHFGSWNDLTQCLGIGNNNNYCFKYLRIALDLSLT